VLARAGAGAVVRFLLMACDVLSTNAGTSVGYTSQFGGTCPESAASCSNELCACAALRGVGNLYTSRVPGLECTEPRFLKLRVFSAALGLKFRPTAQCADSQRHLSLFEPTGSTHLVDPLVQPPGHHNAKDSAIP